ncbi:MAG TPA: RusA family crossover junction endodeoxyribonuclease [Xanthobacteraceae bacterium]|nr:RusA family crossover junction endodeoxyribonuclease [Xanthobacteraceae bacterium]
MRLAFVVPGPPVPSERVRKVPFRKRNGKLGIRGFTPPRSVEYMQRVEAFARSAMQQTPAWRAIAEGKEPLRVHLHFVRAKWLGDLDNLQKSAIDGLQKAGVLTNDNRIVQILASVHTDKTAKHRTEIILERATRKQPGALWKTLAILHGWTPPKGIAA